jgi:sporulation protein YlmC with PRC-barrel domain
MRPRKGLKRVRDITGATVENRRSEELGFVYDLVISSEGCIQYAILSYDDFLGIGDRMIPIPWRLLTEEGHTVIIDVDRNFLDHAPSFDNKTWPIISEAEWQETIEKYFENVPHGAPRTGAGNRAGKESGSPLTRI